MIAITVFLQFAWYTLAQLWLFLQGLSVGVFDNLQAPLPFLEFQQSLAGHGESRPAQGHLS